MKTTGSICCERNQTKLRKKKEETPGIICVGCEQRVPLWDEMEQCFASPEIAASVMERSGRLTSFAVSVMHQGGRLSESEPE